MNNDQDELTDGNIKNLERSALLNLDLKIMLDSAETIWEGRAFQGFNNLCTESSPDNRACHYFVAQMVHVCYNYMKFFKLDFISCY